MLNITPWETFPLCPLQLSGSSLGKPGGFSLLKKQGFSHQVPAEPIHLLYRQQEDGSVEDQKLGTRPGKLTVCYGKRP